MAGYLIPVAVMTAGYSLFQTANNTAVMTCSRADQRGLVSGLVNLSRNLGLITGAAFMGAVFAFGAATPDITALTPQAAASGLTVAFAVAGGFVLAALLIAVLSHLATRRTQPLRAE